MTIMRRFSWALAGVLACGLLVGQEKPDPEAAIKAQLDQAEALGPQVYTYALRRLGGKLKPEELKRRRIAVSRAALSITPWYPIQSASSQSGGNVLDQFQSAVHLFGLDIYLETQRSREMKPFTRAEIGEIISVATTVKRHRPDCADGHSDSIRPLFDYWGEALSRKLVQDADRDYLLGLLGTKVETALDLTEYLQTLDRSGSTAKVSETVGLGIRILNQANTPPSGSDNLFQGGSLVKGWGKASREAAAVAAGSPDAAWGALRSYARRLLSADYCDAEEVGSRLQLVKSFNEESKVVNPDLVIKQGEIQEATKKARALDGDPPSAMPPTLLPLFGQYVEARENKDDKAAANAWAFLKEEWLKFDPKDAVDDLHVFNQQAAVPLIVALGSGLTGGPAEQEDAVRTLTGFLKAKAARPALRTPWVVACIALSELAGGGSSFGPALPPAPTLADLLKKSEIPELVYLANLPLADDKPSLVP